jgi:DNA-binding transcriptional LysR family regulator
VDVFRQLDIFLRVARSGSFTAVAAQVGHSPAAIARHINALEKRLGVRLLNRSTRSLSLTQAGRSYAELCERVVNDVSQCESQLSALQNEASGSIKVIVPKTFGSLQLGDAVIAFCHRHPNIAISIVFEDSSARPHDFVERGYDMALRWGVDLQSNTLVARQIGVLTRKLCAAPEYLGQHGTPQRPSDLESHNCLVHLIAAADSVWRFGESDQEISVKVRGDFTADSALMLRKAAIAGRGVAILPLFCIHDDLRSGTLVEVLPKYPVPPNPLVVLYLQRRLLPSRVRLFIDFLREWFDHQMPSL